LTEVVSTSRRRERRLIDWSPVEAGLFFFERWCNTLSITTLIQRHQRMDRIAQPGREIYPVFAEPTYRGPEVARWFRYGGYWERSCLEDRQA
jgi:hypothetical protein